MKIRRRLQKIVVQENLIEFFKELVDGAIQNQKLETDEMAEFYLVNLLADFHKTKKIRSKCPKTGEEEPMALTYLRACGAGQQQQFSLFKNLGDRSLYLSGCFSAHLENTANGLPYYISMGENAYTGVASLMGQSKRDLSELFQELSDKFSAFVEVLMEVSESASLQKDSDLLKLYEHWLKTGSRRAQNSLVKAGISLDPRSEDTLQ